MKAILRTLIMITALVAALVSVTWVTKDRLDSMRNHRVEIASLNFKEVDRQLKCMTDNLYYEAAMEPTEGKIAVAQVVMNRVDSPQFPKDVCAVVYQKSTFASGVLCQFTWLCDGSVGRNPINRELYRNCEEVAKRVMLEGFRLPSLEGALYYHADYVNPRWRKIRVAKIGRHIFYKPMEAV